MHIKQHTGFTLIELMAVIAIIGILASITVVGLQGAREKARDKSAVAAMQAFLVEATLYKSKNGGSYANVCDDDSKTEAKKYKDKVDAENGTANTITCVSDAISFGFVAKLYDGTSYCVDSTRYMGTAQASLSSGVCNP